MISIMREPGVKIEIKYAFHNICGNKHLHFKQSTDLLRSGFTFNVEEKLSKLDFI